ncbi:BTAD domain-containing putative transcriptional regulator [Streptomyces polygonati]|uniref:BTAD domain-containing putative transcriptional regulator n=1 Tax=Streptomyces polygonati TaxID=1617087 RepID=A0ABV8HWD1_9ACTN
MRYAILGTTQALRDDGTPATLAGGRLRALLTALALRPGRVVGAETLIGEVWDGDPPAGPTGALQALVGRLRRAIGHEAVASVDGGYRLEVARDEVDLYRFERLAEEGARALGDGDPVKASGLLGDALALWRGPALADLPDRGTAAVRVEAHRLDARRHRLTAELRLGRAGQILPELAELAAGHPLDEPLRALHIRALRAAGRTADALAAYEAVRRDLADRLGTDPSVELRMLHAELLAPAPLPPPGGSGGSGAEAGGSPAGTGAGGPGGRGPIGARPERGGAAEDWPAGARRDGVGGSPAGAGAGQGGPAEGEPTRGGAVGGQPPGTGRGTAGGCPPAPGRNATADGDRSGAGQGAPAGGYWSSAGRGVAVDGDASGVGAAGPVGGAGGPAGQEGGAGRRGAGGGGGRLPGNGRARLTSFVGREADLAAVEGDLGRARLVTITGPGGTGKTRLSQEAGDRVAGRWADGVWYAELAPVSDPRTLPEAVISSLGLRDTLLHTGSAAEAAIAAETKAKDPARQLADYCAGRDLLLVLDNCEHVIDAAATLTELLLASCPGVSVLATSREPLGVPGELVRPLDPLPDPPALRLLADRGAAARPGFSVEDDPVACAELCRRLDGLPLAIELAAARLRSMSPRQLADRLDDRFRLLTGGSRTLLPRQQTLRAVVDWSWDLLDPPERVLLRRLAVFRGGWTLEAAEAICADPPDTRAAPAAPAPESPADPAADRIDAPDAAALLSSLVDKSLVLADLTAGGARYRMLETIHEYAAERLDATGERPAVERRHIAYFREYARTADPLLRGTQQLVWFDRLETEHENLRAALRRAVAAGDEQEALMLVLGCNWFWEVRNYASERRYWPGTVSAMAPDPFAEPPNLVPVERGPLEDPPPLRGERLLEARRHARFIDLASRDGEGEWWTDPALMRIGKALIDSYPPHLPQSARVPGILRAYGAFFSGEFDRLHLLLDETVACCRAYDRTWELAYALQLRAKVNNDVRERRQEAFRDISESRRLFERLGDEWGMAETLSAEAEAAGNAGDWPRAVECCVQGIALARRIGSHQHVPNLTVRMGDALINCGEWDEGVRLLHEGIEDAERFGSTSDGASFFGKILLVGALGRHDDAAEALELIDETMRRNENAGPGIPGFVGGMLRGVKGALLGKLGEPEQGLALLSEGLDELADHPLTNVITPRLAVLLAPAGIRLLRMLGAPDGAPPRQADRDGRNHRRLRRAAALVGAHDRLRPSAIPPAEQRELDEDIALLRALLGEEVFDAEYAEGEGLPFEEAFALMRDMD